MFVKKGIVIGLGGAGEVDDTHVYGPSCIVRNGHVWCYYTGFDGYDYRIALAVSSDGMNFIKKGVVIPLGGGGEVDDIHVYHPSCITRNGHVWCYFSSHDGASRRIALAVSKDGMNFVKKGVVIPLGGSGEVDDTHVYTPSCFIKNRCVWCYYTAYDGSNHRIALAISEDGMNFIKKGIVIGPGGEGEVDSTIAYNPSCFIKNRKVWCYYTANNGAYYRTALAVSKDGMNFIKKGVVIPLGNAGEIDDIQACHPSCFVRNGHVWCYYSSHDGSIYRVALAISENGT